MRRSQSMIVPSPSIAPEQLVTQQHAVEDVIIWRGQLQWTAKQNGEVFQRAAIGQVAYRGFKEGIRISGEGWPPTLLMQMIPKSVLTLLGQEGCFIGSKTVALGLQNCEAVDSLRSYMQSGHLGCVHVDSELKNLFCPVKVFMLHYTGRGFVGVIPNDQITFINRLRQTIQQKRDEALQRQRSLSIQQYSIEYQQQQQQQQLQYNNAEQQQQQQHQQYNVYHQQLQQSQSQNQIHTQQQYIEEITIESDGEAEPKTVNHNAPDSPESLPPENSGYQNQDNIIQPENDPKETTFIDVPISERGKIWSGTLQWLEKQPGSLRIESILRHVVCHVTAQFINGKPKVDGQFWPVRLVMQLIPKELLIQICENGQHEMKTVGFELVDCEAVHSLTQLMKSGFAGCVHFSPDPKCPIKLLILLYSKELQCYLGFVPTDQVGLVTKIRDVIVKRKEEISARQAQQYKKIQAENALSAQQTEQKRTSASLETITTTLEDNELSENAIAGAAEKTLEQLSNRSDDREKGSNHHCTAFRLI